jgi:acyl carrier protein
MKQDAAATITSYILREFLPGEDPASLQPTTPLISSGVIDSIAMLSFVAFLEESFGIKIAAHEMTAENLNTIERIASFILEKQR